MKKFKLVPVFLLLLLASCSSVSVYSDYDKNVDFASYKTYAFFKPGIDKVEISDLDKRRILHAIDTEMQAKGFTKSENPDLLVNIFTKSREQVSVNQFSAGWGYGWGWGWNPYMMYGGNQTTVSTSTVSTSTGSKAIGSAASVSTSSASTAKVSTAAGSTATGAGTASATTSAARISDTKLGSGLSSGVCAAGTFTTVSRCCTPVSVPACGLIVARIFSGVLTV
jgi:hypothetical protein